MTKQSRRQKARAEKRSAKERKMRNPGSESNYARKRDNLNNYNRKRTPMDAPPQEEKMGFDFPIGHKPWKK